jgi:hypothetical protein
MVLRQVGFAIVMETMAAAAAAPKDWLCAMMMMLPLVMPFVWGRPVWHVPGELARDSGSMSSGTFLL